MKRGGVQTSRSHPRDTSAQNGKNSRVEPRLEPYPAEIAAIRRLPYGLKSFRRLARLLGLEIHPFQTFMLGFYFAGVTELIILISKKNGKTTLLAALALYHLLMKPNAECVIGASSRDQATILFNQAARLVMDAKLERRALPEERRYMRYEGVFEVLKGYRVIKFEQGRIRVLAADADTADGVIPTLALVDELHRHPSGELYGVFRDGLLNSAQMITISTAGSSMDSPLGKLLARAREFAVEQEDRRRTYSSPDGSFVLVEWALGEGDDPHDLKAVESVNPAPWHTKTTLRQRHDSPSTSPGQWLRFACGIWTEGEEPWVHPQIWDQRRADLGNISDGDRVFVAIRAGAGIGIGIAAPRGDGGVAVAVQLIPAPLSGRAALRDAEFALRRICERYDVQEIAFDPDQFQRSAEILDQEGLPMIEIPQRPQRLAQATATLWRLISAGLLQHDGDLSLRDQVLAGQTKETSMGWRLEPNAHTAGLVALAMAVHQATQVPSEPPTFVAI